MQQELLLCFSFIYLSQNAWSSTVVRVYVFTIIAIVFAFSVYRLNMGSSYRYCMLVVPPYLSLVQSIGVLDQFESRQFYHTP